MKSARLWRLRPGSTRARAVLALAAGVALLALWVRLGPLPAGLLDPDVTPATLVVDRSGHPLYEARASDGTRGIVLVADNLPPIVVAATIAAEDRRFWSHPGVDIVAIARALRTNLSERSVVEGGSTIPQQVAKLLLNRRDPDRRRGVRAKVHEAIIALRLEHRFSKRELLAQYLNLAGYGNQIAGVERASRAYFGVPAAMITPAQAAFLAGLPQRPSTFNPHRNLDAALSRQRTVLQRMHAAGTLTAEALGEARAERLALRPASAAFAAPHFVQMVLSELGGSRPAKVQTTLDLELQDEVSGVIESHRRTLAVHGAGNVAVVVLHNATGQWLAWEGSGAYQDAARGGTINGARSPRQPGSALKPFTYALAFEDGFSPASVLADVPSSFPTGDEGIVYAPRNYDGQFRGPLLARAALAGSENVPAVALTAHLGVARLQRFLGRAGISTLDRTSSHYGLGLTLGNAEVRLDELVAAYATFARGGEWIAPTFLTDGALRQSRRVVSPRTAFWITDVLSDPDAREYIFGRGGSLDFPFPVAVKTGTSQAYHDNWTVGYSRHVTVGVWVGNFDRKPLRNSSGVTGAAPIFHGVMLAAERRYAGGDGLLGRSAIVTPTTDTRRREICAMSGLAANDWCPNRRSEWIAVESALLPCGWHHLADGEVLTVLPPEYDAWNAAGRSSRSTRPALDSQPASGADPVAQTRRPASSLSIASPPDGATYLIDPTLRREFQTLSLKAIAAGEGVIDWSVNGRSLGSTSGGQPLEWPLAPGRHRFAVKDRHGRSAEAAITVR